MTKILNIDASQPEVISIDVPFDVSNLGKIMLNGKEVFNVDTMLATDIELKMTAAFPHPVLTIRAYPRS